jgi:hypothetical protein
MPIPLPAMSIFFSKCQFGKQKRGLIFFFPHYLLTMEKELISSSCSLSISIGILVFFYSVFFFFGSAGV